MLCPCFVVHVLCVLSIAGEEGADCFTVKLSFIWQLDVIVLLSPNSTVGWSAVFDCGISWLCSLDGSLAYPHLFVCFGWLM